MRICCASSWFLSMSILTSRTAPLASFTAFSSAGPSVLQGPHQVAQKSTITGTVLRGLDHVGHEALGVAVLDQGRRRHCRTDPRAAPIN